MLPVRAGLAAAVVGYSWWATGLEPFELGSTLAVVGAGIAAMAWGSRAASEAPRPTLHRPDIAIWSVLLGALAAWELAAYVQHPRDEHPTVSSLLDAALDTHPERTAALVVWLVVASRLARR